MPKQIDTKEYMQAGWDSGPTGAHPYKRGSFHNKAGMTIMWIFYGIVIVQVFHAISVIPFFPITFIMLLFGLYTLYIAIINR